MATNKIHSGKKCGPCSLCKQKKFHYTHISEWNDDQKQFLKTIEANISQSSCICKVCADDVKRNMHEDDYTPRWRKTKPKCKVIGCKKVNGIKLCNVTNKPALEHGPLSLSHRPVLEYRPLILSHGLVLEHRPLPVLLISTQPGLPQ